MPRIGIALLGALGVFGAFLGWLLVSVLLLFYGNDWWLSGLVTLTVLVWLAGLLVVLFQQGRLRAAATGAVIASAAYWLLALGPWFGTTVGPTLLTSRGLSQLDLLLHGPPQQTQALAWQTYPQAQAIYMTGSGIATPGGLPTTSLGFTNTTMVPAGNGLLPTFGHWSLIWLCAGVGGCAAFLMHWRAEKKSPRPPGPTAQAGESPFAPAAPPSAFATNQTAAPPAGVAP
jgi:hypothetical protein